MNHIQLNILFIMITILSAVTTGISRLPEYLSLFIIFIFAAISTGHFAGWVCSNNRNNPIFKTDSGEKFTK